MSDTILPCEWLKPRLHDERFLTAFLNDLRNTVDMIVLDGENGAEKIKDLADIFEEAAEELKFNLKISKDVEYSLTKENERLATKVRELQEEIKAYAEESAGASL